MLTWIIVFKKTIARHLAETHLSTYLPTETHGLCPGGGGGELLELLESSSRGPVEASIRLAGIHSRHGLDWDEG